VSYKPDKYPEHAKLAAVRDKSQAIGEFLDIGLGQQGLYLAESGVPTFKSIPDILARYFEIDQNALEREKQAMMEEFRERRERTEGRDG
jgi:hypothetical protein